MIDIGTAVLIFVLALLIAGVVANVTGYRQGRLDGFDDALHLGDDPEWVARAIFEAGSPFRWAALDEATRDVYRDKANRFLNTLAGGAS